MHPIHGVSSFIILLFSRLVFRMIISTFWSILGVSILAGSFYWVMITMFFIDISVLHISGIHYKVWLWLSSVLWVGRLFLLVGLLIVSRLSYLLHWFVHYFCLLRYRQRSFPLRSDRFLYHLSFLCTSWFYWLWESFFRYTFITGDLAGWSFVPCSRVLPMGIWIFVTAALKWRLSNVWASSSPNLCDIQNDWWPFLPFWFWEESGSFTGFPYSLWILVRV